MTKYESYEFAQLTPILEQKIEILEKELNSQTDETVLLIAYSQKGNVK